MTFFFLPLMWCEVLMLFILIVVCSVGLHRATREVLLYLEHSGTVVAGAYLWKKKWRDSSLSEQEQVAVNVTTDSESRLNSCPQRLHPP